jgi:hypothetical protein
MPVMIQPGERAGVAALLRFHLGVGARLAMRVLAPVLAAAVGLAMLLGVDFQRTLATTLFGTRSRGGSGLAIFLLCLAVAASAAPRVCRGLDGWIRHLPVAGIAHRRAATLALAVAQTPLLLLLVYFSLAAFRGSGPWLANVAGLGVAALAAALCATPVERPLLARPLAAMAGALAQGGGWALGAALALCIFADLAAGALRRPGRRAAPRERWPALPPAPRIAWRALGPHLAGAYAAGLLPLAAAATFVAHNEIAPVLVARIARLGGGGALAFLFAGLGEALATRRPAWPWARSLPTSAARRVRSDALFLGLHAAPLLALTAAVEPLAAVAVLALAPFLAAQAAAAMRRAPERRTGAAGEILAAALPAAAAVALLPWVAPLLLAATPWMLRAAAARDRRQKVSRWLELHHLAAGDPQSWSA